MTSPSFPEHRDESGRTPFLFAAMKGCEAEVQRLLASGANPHAVDDDGRGAIALAAIRGHIEVLKVLVAHGLAVDGQDATGWTPLALASHFGHAGAMDVLLMAGAKPENFVPALLADHSILNVAAQFVVNKLIAAGADPSSLGVSGEPVLIRVIQDGYDKKALLLVAAGADLAAVGDQGQTALHEALARDEINPKLIKALLDAGADPDACDEVGGTCDSRLLPRRKGAVAASKMLASARALHRRNNLIALTEGRPSQPSPTPRL